MLRQYFFTLCLGSIFAVTTPNSLAQSPKPDRGSYKSYPHSHFSQFNPQTARDMVDRLPGFSLDLGSEARGLSSNGGNVLVDGSRPVSKTGGLEEVLDRMPADIIERIDIIRGRNGSGETSGQSLVANIVKRTNVQSGNWSVKLERAPGGKLNSIGDLSVVKTLGRWETSSRFKAVMDRRPLDGTRISRDERGVETFLQTDSRPSDSRTFSISSEAYRALVGGSLVLSTNFTRKPYSSDTDRLGFESSEAIGSPISQREINFDRTILEGEFGADWSKLLENEWRIKIISLSSFSDTEENQATLLNSPVGNRISKRTFFRDADTFETVLRTTAMHESEIYGLTSNIGAEIAYNKLDSNLTLSETTRAGVDLISVPTADIVVDETRAELFGNINWQAFDKTSFELGLGAELSEIEVSGDAKSVQSFFFLKPHVFVVHDYRPGVQLRFDGRHKVSQLDFRDFAASASASDDRLTAGNPDLGPDQATRASFSLDLASKRQGAVNVELFHEWRHDVLEDSVLPTGAQGVANSGSARAWGIKTIASLPLSRYIPGGLFELEAEFLDSRFSDPITGKKRELSNTDSPTIVAEFRQDLDKQRVSWGVSYQAESDGTFFFADEESYNLDSDKWDAFIETTRYFGMKARLSWSSIGGQNFIRERRFFTADRSGPPLGSQLIGRDRGAFAAFTLSGQF